MNWFYVEGGKSVGPISEDKLSGLIGEGKVSPETLVWREGMAEWKPCREAGPPPRGDSARAPETPSKGGAFRKIHFYGSGGTLLGIHLVNTFFTLLTLGIYFFWGRVKLRKYQWGQMDIDGDRLTYHGTGRETLLGWLKAAVFFGIPYLAFRYVPHWVGASVPWVVAGGVCSAFMILCFLPFAIVGSRRYRLSRTGWRGIRLSFRGSSKAYALLVFGGTFLKIFTLGLYSPYYDARRDRFLVDQSYVGNQNFLYDGRGEDLFKPFLAAWLLTLPTLGLSLLWYHVQHTRYLWNHTLLCGGRFNCTITFGGLLWVEIVNVLLVILTLGFGFTWAQVRSIRYMTRNLSLEESARIETIEQEAQSVNATGEELASFLDLDFDLG
jgi:uncharacterized membrane protein YjgN (DUF898 family)